MFERCRPYQRPGAVIDPSTSLARTGLLVRAAAELCGPLRLGEPTSGYATREIDSVIHAGVPLPAGPSAYVEINTESGSSRNTAAVLCCGVRTRDCSLPVSPSRRATLAAPPAARMRLHPVSSSRSR